MKTCGARRHATSEKVVARSDFPGARATTKTEEVRNLEIKNQRESAKRNFKTDGGKQRVYAGFGFIQSQTQIRTQNQIQTRTHMILDKSWCEYARPRLDQIRLQ